MALRTHWKRGDAFILRHSDPSILVVEKRAGLLTHPTAKGTEPNLIAKVRYFMGERERRPLVLPVHRLDRVVSGLIVYARTPQAREDLVTQFAEHSVKRIYTAAVQGILPRDEGTFDSWLYTDDPSLVVYSVAPESPDSRRAVTHWRVLERFQASGATLVEVELETGLRNQIRVQFAEAGFPLLGERKYQPREHAKPQKTHRIFLHAGFLGFIHPYTGKYVRFEADLPPDLANWHKSLTRGKASVPRARPRFRRPRRG